MLILHIQSQFASVSAYYQAWMWSLQNTRHVPLFATKTAYSHAGADARGWARLSRRERILKSPSWDPAGYNKDLRERALSDIAPREWGEGRGCVAPRKIPQSCSSRLREISTSDTSVLLLVVFDPGFRVYAVTYLPPLSRLCPIYTRWFKRASCMRSNLSLTKKRTKILPRELSENLNFIFLRYFYSI